MCGVARQGAAGKALSAQGFVVVVGRPRETFTENACRTGIRGNRILDGTGENLLVSSTKNGGLGLDDIVNDGWYFEKM